MGHNLLYVPTSDPAARPEWTSFTNPLIFLKLAELFVLISSSASLFVTFLAGLFVTMPEHPVTHPDPRLPALPPAATPATTRPRFVPERSDFLDGDAPASEKVEAFLARALEATGSHAPAVGAARVPWIGDALLSNHSVKAYGRDFLDSV